MATFRKRQRKKLDTPVNKPNGRKALNLKHSLWEANDIIDIRLSQANDSVDMDKCFLRIVSKISELHSRSSFLFRYTITTAK